MPGATVATLLMLGALHARRLYDDKQVWALNFMSCAYTELLSRYYCSSSALKVEEVELHYLISG